jgi:hypothetical protein
MTETSWAQRHLVVKVLLVDVKAHLGLLFSFCQPLSEGKEGRIISHKGKHQWPERA